MPAIFEMDDAAWNAGFVDGSCGKVTRRDMLHLNIIVVLPFKKFGVGK